MSDDKKNDNGAEFLMELVKCQGVACSTVKDGHILMFKRAWLVDLLAQHPDNPELCIFIKRPDFAKGN
jgi:hypothetical protein